MLNPSAPFKLPYSAFTWFCWIVLAFCAGRFRRWRGVILGQFTVATVIFLLNFRWLQEVMEQFEWRGRLGLDLPFVIGVLVHVVVVNLLLLPLNIFGLLLAPHRPRPEKEPPPLPSSPTGPPKGAT